MPNVCLPLVRRVSLATTLLLSPAVFAATPPVFPVLHYEPYAVNNPLTMVEGDVNGDGVTDTVYASASPTALGGSLLTSALRSKTSGSPAIVTGGSVPCTANSLTLADLNKDNQLDAILTCIEGSVAVMQGNGDGTFQTASIYTVASSAKAVTADLNGDGYPDLVIATNTGTTASTFAVLINEASAGPITLGTPTIYGGAIGSTQLMTGDVNGDGKQDVIAGGNPGVFSGPSAAIFYGNGDGTLKPASFSGGTTNNLTLADFNGDGVTDIAAFNGDPSYEIATHVNVSLGPYSNNGASSVLLPLGIVALHAVDVNDDGRVDLVLTGSTTTVLLNDGAGNLTVGRSYATPGSYYSAQVNGNGKTDLVFTTTRGFYTLSGNGDGTFNGLPALFDSDVAATGDTNGDGLTDFVAIEQTVGIQISAVGRGDGTFSVLNSLTDQLKSFPLLADFDADGVADLAQIYSSSGQSILAWSKGSSNGLFVRNFASSDPVGKGALAAVAGDFDGDGKKDLIASYLDTSAGAANVSGLILLQGNGDGTFAAPLPVITSTTAVSGKPLAADLNGDGKLDIIWGDIAYLNQGNGTFSPVTLPIQGTAMAVGDINGDGIADLVIDNTIHAGNGDGTFQAAALYTIGAPQNSTYISVSIGDVNGDGSADVVLQYMADMAGLSVAFGDGKGNFTADTNVYTTGTKAPTSAALARLNNQAPVLPNDNRLDFIVFADGAAVSLLNQTNPAPVAPAPLASKLALAVYPGSVVPLQPTTLTSTITGLNPTGTVTFTTADGTALGKAGVGLSAAILQPSFPTGGTYTVTAAYSGDSNNAPSVSNPVTVSVAKGSSTTQLQLAFPTIPARVVSTVSAIVSGYKPTAQVTFTTGATTLGTAPVLGGIATLQYRIMDVGSYPLTASYPGDASNLPSTSSIDTVTVVPGPDFSLTVTPTTNTVTSGNTATFTLTITPINSYTGTLQLGCQIASLNATCPSTPLSLSNGLPATATLSFKTPLATSNQPRISFYGTMGAALLLFGWKRRGRSAGLKLSTCILTLGLAIVLLATSGCSSSAQSANPNPGTTYSIVISGEDDSIVTTHTVTAQLTVMLGAS
jgi:hypothetical protein